MNLGDRSPPLDVHGKVRYVPWTHESRTATHCSHKVCDKLYAQRVVGVVVTQVRVMIAVMNGLVVPNGVWPADTSIRGSKSKQHTGTEVIIIRCWGNLLIPDDTGTVTFPRLEVPDPRTYCLALHCRKRIE